MTDILPIRLAAVDDMETIIGMVDEAAAWLETRGTDQWASPWPNRAGRDGRILRGIRTGRTWIAEEDDEPVATVTYCRHGNHKLWNSEEQDDPAVYISRLIVSRKHMGDQIGASLIDWAAFQAVKAWNAQWIRIDVWTTNIALYNYYEKQKFAPVRICRFDSPRAHPSAALFQKPAAEFDEAKAVRFTAVNGNGRPPGLDLVPLPACP